MRSRLSLFVALCALVGSASLAQELAPPPEKPFKALHLFNLPSAEAEAKVLSVIADLNDAVAKAGHPKIRYQLWKVAGVQQGAHAYLLESMWPGRAVYEEVHDGAAFKAAQAKHPEVAKLFEGEVYNRLVEVPSGR